MKTAKGEAASKSANEQAEHTSHTQDDTYDDGDDDGKDSRENHLALSATGGNLHAAAIVGGCQCLQGCP